MNIGGMEWLQSETWKLKSENFVVEVVHWTDKSDYTGGYGPNFWNVYAYIYPGHPVFSELKGCETGCDLQSKFPFHGGVSYFKRHRDGNNPEVIISVQMGSDYGHLGDDFWSASKPEHALRVFLDAKKLYNALSETDEPANPGTSHS